MFGEDSLSDVIKQRISTPFFANYLISWLLFNKEVTLAIFFLDENDKVYNKYCYYQDCVNTKIEILPIIFKANLCFESCPSVNYLWAPFLTAVFVTAGLPYIKAFFNFFNDNSKLFGDRLFKKYNPFEFIKITRYEDLRRINEDLESKNKRLIAETSNFEDRMKEKNILEVSLNNQLSEIQKNVQLLNEDKRARENEINRLKDITSNTKPSFGSIFKGRWLLNYMFFKIDERLSSGTETLFIEDDYKYMVQEGSSVYLRCKIKYYSCFTSASVEFLNKISNQHSYGSGFNVDSFLFYIEFEQEFIPRTKGVVESSFNKIIIIDHDSAIGYCQYFQRRESDGSVIVSDDNVELYYRKI